jgi:outer membrane protein assembly factor BamA
VGADVEYLHSQAQLAFDWRPAPGYARRGGFYAVTAHDYTDRNDEFGFERLDAEIIQHVPILREAWTISLRAHTSTTHDKDAQQIPYFFLPTVGGGNDLRGWSSYRFRDRNSILFQAEWRIQVNRFLDTAFFYDAGKVTARTRDLGFTGLEDDYGFGVRFHGPTATALRIDLARSRDGLRAVFASSHVF